MPASNIGNINNIGKINAYFYANQNINAQIKLL